ncbi:ricin-type beta-trefoil lectin domain protein [Streptomyces sp. ME19-01-6]|uniref:ricin-type beta-trefoil lectin domain protein n=1 Tax=Streptomyces sp. ME19-01-6 TaxID=3028686 RepID=UPI0029A7B955|nr:ricin-type beta-trefoil lectin domain protein [Streptomyces sp. ME19-01-6]MDX3224949.1 ricin-type beta-trefoil lectin domain protein [Streptomyces sp. ME19-01-6]
MTRAARDDGDVEADDGVLRKVSDAQLTKLLRTGTPAAYPALRELRGRHRPSVLAYARVCTADENAARRLTAQAFALAARDTVRGSEPHGPWRHQLLLLAHRVAASWAAEERAACLDTDLLTRVHWAGPEAPLPPMLAAFQELPARGQGLLWYGVVEQEPPERVANLLGLSPQEVAYGIEPALWRLRQSLLKTRLDASGHQHCQGFQRLIEESVRPGTQRCNADLHTHMGHCGHCATAYEELSQLRDTPRTTLAEGLLPWGGAAYARGDTGEQTRAGTDGLTNGWPSRRIALGATAVGAAVAPLLVYLLVSGGSEHVQAASSVRTPPSSPTPTVTAPRTPSPSPTPRTKSSSPTPTPTPTASKTAQPALPKATPKPKPKPTAQPPAAHPPNGTYAQMVNVASDLCLDIRDGVMDLGTDVITAPCTSSATQRWRVDAARGVLQSFADPGFCLDSRGSTDKGIGIWECSALHSRNGQNLRFTVDSRGVVRPAIASGHAVTPFWGDALFLLPDQGGEERRWKAGAK